MTKNFLIQESKEYCAPVCEVISLGYDCDVLDSSTGGSSINDWYEDEDELTIG